MAKILSSSHEEKGAKERKRMFHLSEHIVIHVPSQELRGNTQKANIIAAIINS